MNNLTRILVLLFLALFLVAACSSDDGAFQAPDDDINQTGDDDGTTSGDDPDSSDAYKMVDVGIQLPTGADLDLSGAKVVSLGSASDLDADLKGELPYNPGTAELAYLVDANDEFLLAAFLNEGSGTISVGTTAEVLLYFGLASFLRNSEYKEIFVENVGSAPGVAELKGKLEAKFINDPTLFSTGNYIAELNEAIQQITEKSTIDIGSKTNFNTIESSGLKLNEEEAESFSVSNSYPRRTHAFLYKLSFVDENGQETVLNAEVSGGDTADETFEIPFLRLEDESNDNLQGRSFNASMCTSGAQYATETSDMVNLPLGEGRIRETYELAVIGPGRGTAIERELTTAEMEKFEELSIKTFVMEYFIPILLDVGGNKGVYSLKSIQQAEGVADTVEPILRAHEPTLSAVLANDFETALIEFLPFLYGDIRLSNDLRTILGSLYGIVSNGSSPNTFIQNNELIQEGELRYQKVMAVITRTLEESSALTCINQRIGSSAKLEKWEIDVEEGIVALEPEYLVTSNTADGKEIIAKVLSGKNENATYEYEWETTSSFGGFISDANGNNGTSFTSTSERVLFISTAENSELSDDENIETVSVTVYEVEGASRTEVGSASMEVNVIKDQFEIRPEDAIVQGDTDLVLYIANADGETVIPNEEQDYKIEWSIPGNHGMLEGNFTTLTNFNSAKVTYQCTDSDTEDGEEPVQARIYVRPKGSTDEYRLLDDIDGKIKVQNEELTLRYYVDIMVGQNRDVSGIFHNAQVWNFFSWNTKEAEADIPEGYEVERYDMRIMERIPEVIPSCTQTSESWTPQMLPGGEAGDDLELKCPVSAISSPKSGDVSAWQSEIVPRYEAARGYAQVTVYLKPEN